MPMKVLRCFVPQCPARSSLLLISVSVITINSIGFIHQIERLPAFVELMRQCDVTIINVNALIVHSAFPEMRHHAKVFEPSRHKLSSTNQN